MRDVLTDPAGPVGALLLLTAGAVLLRVAWLQRRRRGVDRLRRVLAEETTDAEDTSVAAAWSALVRAADQVGSGSGAYAALGDRLTRAGLPLRAGEALLLLAGAGAGAALLGGLIAGGGIALALGLLVPLVGWLAIAAKADRYSRRCDDLLPDALAQMAAAMRAGHSLQQAIEGVAEHGQDPLAGELRRVLGDTKVGRPLDEALIAMGERVGSADLRWTVRAMLIQRRTGGRLADILEVLAEFMRDRTEVRREVAALTAEGRISAIILIALPFVVLAGILFTNASYLDPLFSEPLGRIMLIGAGISMTVAWVLMRGIIKVEV